MRVPAPSLRGLLTFVVAIAAAAAPVAVSAQARSTTASNVPPPANPTPAPPPSTVGYGFTDAVDKVNTAKKAIIEGAGAAIGHADDLHLKGTSKGLGYVGYALKASKIATAQPGQQRWEAVGDLAVGACLDLACGYAGPAVMACSAAVACADGALEIGSGKSLGGWVGYGAHAVKEALLPTAPEPMPDRRADLRGRFEQRQSSDRDYAAQMSTPANGGYDDSYDDGGAAAFGALLGVLNAQAAPRAPMTPIAPAGGPCHPGHDEQAHPGGCHQASGGN